MIAKMVKVQKGVSYDADGLVCGCIFCDIVNNSEPAVVVEDSDEFIVFRTIAPATKDHLLVCPKEHINNVYSLCGEEHARLVKRLRSAGSRCLQLLGHTEDAQRHCFHVPPYNSIDHLHLHSIGTPSSMTWLGHLKYYDQSFYCHSADRVIMRLLSGVPNPSSTSKKSEVEDGAKDEHQCIRSRSKL